MPKISETFNFGGTEDITPETLLRQIEIMYTDLAVAINKKPDCYQRDVDGQTTDTFLSNGDININTDTLKVEILTSHVNVTPGDPTTVTWQTI